MLKRAQDAHKAQHAQMAMLAQDTQDAQNAQNAQNAKDAHHMLRIITAKMFIKSNKSSGIFRDSVYELVLRLLMVHIHLHTNLTVGEIAFQTWMKPYSCAPQHFHASVCRLADILLSTEKTE